MSPDLSKILTSSLYQKIIDLYFPWKKGELDMEVYAKIFQGEPDNSRQLYDTLHASALKPISTFCPSIPVLSTYLNPAEPQYPEHALALILLIDQGPRQLYKGLDLRWTNCFFDITVQKLVKALIYAGNLPDATEKWCALGYTFEEAMIHKIWFYAPLVHSEYLDNHDFVADKMEVLRREVELYAGVSDPGRKTRKEDATDVELFGKLILAGPPTEFASFMFWICRLFEAHRPIIERYGHYPYRNQVCGRETNAEDQKWLDLTGNFGMPWLTKEQVEKLKQLARDDEWEELSDNGPW
ncbi:hypothetical protein C8J56DRAFT_892513 [Mycena floridula]|nr:hypothetical protein C8J56DRAFT_892513 [Mycena floridula]